MESLAAIREPDDIWGQVLNHIRSRNEHLFKSWLANTEVLRIDDGVVWLKVPSDFVGEYIEGKYLPLIKSAMTAVLGKDMDVRFFSEGTSRRSKATESQSEAPASHTNECNLHQRYTFDNFVVGSGNRFAHATARAVAESPSRVYNPLFIYGPAGLGKTHLTQAIGNYVKHSRPAVRILFTPTENFMNEMISAIQNQTTISFKRRYREKDLLLIDDIHFLANKEGLQEEIFHTFNTLYDAGKQIVLTSDRPPKDIPTLQERLTSRFSWGLVVDLQPPDLETRIAILRKKCQMDGIVLPEDVIYYIASQVKSNIRELEGCLIRMLAFSSCQNVDVTLEAAREVLKDIVTDTPSLTVDAIITAVAAYFDLSEDAIKGRRRLASVALPRQIAMYLARKLTTSSLKEIGSKFGKDHSTVIHACNKVEILMHENSDVRQAIDKISRELCE